MKSMFMGSSDVQDKSSPGGRDTFGENIAVCTAASLAGTFYFYEYYYEQWFSVHSIMCIAITAVIALIWMVCAFRSGRNCKLGFIVYAFLYWSVPYIYILYYSSRDNLMDYSAALAFMNRLFRAILYNPFSEAAEKLGTSSVTLAAILLVLIMLMYVCGNLLPKLSRKKSDTDGEDESAAISADNNDNYLH